MKILEAVAALDAIDTSDPERAHSEADDILLQVSQRPVQDAYVRVMKRAPWWASA